VASAAADASALAEGVDPLDGTIGGGAKRVKQSATSSNVGKKRAHRNGNMGNAGPTIVARVCAGPILARFGAGRVHHAASRLEGCQASRNSKRVRIPNPNVFEEVKAIPAVERRRKSALPSQQVKRSEIAVPRLEKLVRVRCNWIRFSARLWRDDEFLHPDNWCVCCGEAKKECIRAGSRHGIARLKDVRIKIGQGIAAGWRRTAKRCCAAETSRIPFRQGRRKDQDGDAVHRRRHGDVRETCSECSAHQLLGPRDSMRAI